MFSRTCKLSCKSYCMNYVDYNFNKLRHKKAPKNLLQYNKTADTWEAVPTSKPCSQKLFTRIQKTKSFWNRI